MTCGRSVEDDDFEVEGFDMFENFGERHGFVYAGYLSLSVGKSVDIRNTHAKS